MERILNWEDKYRNEMLIKELYSVVEDLTDRVTELEKK